MNTCIPPERAVAVLDPRTESERVRLLYAQAPLGIIASLLIAPLLVLVLWPVAPRSILVVWLLALEVTVLARLALTRAFQRCPDADDHPGRWANRYAWACAASGVGWGSCVILLMLSPSPVYDAFIALMLGGVLMGGAFTLSPVFSVYVAYALPLTLPPVLWLMLRDDPLRVVMGVSGLLYLLLALGTAQRFHQTLTRSLRLAAENLYLAQSFAEAREQAEDTSRHLADQEAALRDSVDAMRQLYEVISTPRRTTRDPIQALLTMGCQRFGLDIGILSHIEGERYEVVQVIAPAGALAQGAVFALSDTYCCETLRASGPLGFTQAATDAQRQHPCYRQFGLEAYLGVTVRVGSAVYGTLNFSSVRPRPTPFTPVDYELIQLMAQWVGGALEQERMVAAAQRQQSLLAHASRLTLLGEMASGLAHEINQPIAAIALYAEAGLNRMPPALAPDPARDLLEKIAAQSDRANAIIQRMRCFARQGKPQYATVRVQAVIEDVADFLHLEARRCAVELDYDLAADLPPILADPLQVQQVILNLAHNAIEAMSAAVGLETRRLEIKAGATVEGVEIAVRDSGPGLKPEALAQWRHSFFTTKPEGLGLGLAISQSIVEAHGGRLWATANPDSGVTFHFTLRVAGCGSGLAATRPALADA